jgi:hypothetical protein
LGRDGYRHLKGAVCDNQPMRQEQLDAVVWQEIMRLLEDPSLLQTELDRRLQAAQTTDPLKRREDALRRDQARLTKSIERLLTGYQENLIRLEELRCRMPELRKQQQAMEAELQSLEMTTIDQTRNLHLVETLAQFRTRLCARGNVLEVTERPRVVRLLVQEILVGGDKITIRHSIPMPASSPDSNDGVRPSREPPEPNTGPSYLLRSHGQHTWDNVSEIEVGCLRGESDDLAEYRRTLNTVWMLLRRSGTLRVLSLARVETPARYPKAHSSRGGNRGHVVLFSPPNPWFPSGTSFVYGTPLIPGEFPCELTHLRAPGSDRASFAL